MRTSIELSHDEQCSQKQQALHAQSALWDLRRVSRRPCRRFKRASYTIEAVLPGPPAAASSSSSSDGRAEAGSGPAGSSGQGPGSSGQDPPSSGAAVERVRGVEAELLKRRDELRAFEAAYRQARHVLPGCIEGFSRGACYRIGRGSVQGWYRQHVVT